MDVFLVRHEVSMANERLAPWPDFGDAPLASFGRMRAKHLPGRILPCLSPGKSMAILSSATVRAVQTALPLAKQLGARLHLVDLGEVVPEQAGEHSPMLARHGEVGLGLFRSLVEEFEGGDVVHHLQLPIVNVIDRLEPIVDQRTALDAILACVLEAPSGVDQVVFVTHSRLLMAMRNDGMMVGTGAVLRGTVDPLAGRWLEPPRPIPELAQDPFLTIPSDHMADDVAFTRRMFLGEDSPFTLSHLTCPEGTVHVRGPVEWIPHRSDNPSNVPDAPMVAYVEGAIDVQFYSDKAPQLEKAYPSNRYTWQAGKRVSDHPRSPARLEQTCA
jgi:broad specificity phosphatase PhoE